MGIYLESPSQKPVTQSFDVFLHMNKRMNKQSMMIWDAIALIMASL